MHKKFHKHKILLDENIAQRSSLSLLNSLFDVKHIRDDLHKAGASDKEVYNIAVEQGRIIVTENWSDFLPLLKTKNDAGLIGVGSKNNSIVDSKLTALLKRTRPKSLAGKYKALLGTEQKKKTKLPQ